MPSKLTSFGGATHDKQHCWYARVESLVPVTCVQGSSTSGCGCFPSGTVAKSTNTEAPIGVLVRPGGCPY
eukprot:6438999-Amphidinium_carterae.1